MKINKSLLDYSFELSAVPGCVEIVAVNKEFSYPVATIWYRTQNNGTSISILHMHTIPMVQKQGIMAWLFKKLLLSYEKIHTVVTDSANGQSEPWLIKHGFKQDRTEQWILEIKNKDQK